MIIVSSLRQQCKQFKYWSTGESGNKSVTRHSLCESNGLDRVTEVHG